MKINLYEILKQVLNESVSQDKVSQAIQDRRRVIIDYDDEKSNPPRGERLIEPYVLGVTKGGNLALRAFQYNGKTRRGVPQWKLFRLDRIQSWQPVMSQFNRQVNNLYNPNGDDLMTSILAQVQFAQEPQNDEEALKAMIKRNIEITRQDNAKRNLDLMGKKLKPSVSQQTVQRGPVPTPTTPTVPTNDVNTPNQDMGSTVQQTQQGPVNNDDLKSMQMNQMWNDHEQEQDKNRDWKRFQDKQADERRKERRQMSMADRYKIRTPKKYRDDDYSSLNDEN